MLIKVKVFPNSKKEEVIVKNNNSFEIKTKEKKEKGKANLSVLNQLSNYLKIDKKRIRLIRGGKRENKIFEILD
jgi:uncharacterized protein YggU (UPF0235/DUF167 family)